MIIRIIIELPECRGVTGDLIYPHYTRRRDSSWVMTELHSGGRQLEPRTWSGDPCDTSRDMHVTQWYRDARGGPAEAGGSYHPRQHVHVQSDANAQHAWKRDHGAPYLATKAEWIARWFGGLAGPLEAGVSIASADGGGILRPWSDSPYKLSDFS